MFTLGPARCGTSPTSGCIVENFQDGLSPYEIVSGTPFTYFSIVNTTYGATLDYAGRSGLTTMSMQRSISQPNPCTSFSVKFNVTADAADDTAALAVIGTSLGTLFSVIPKREAFVDPQRRCILGVYGTTYPLGTTAVTIGHWYQIDVQVNTLNTNVQFSFVNLTTSTVVEAGTFTRVSALDSSLYLRFSDDALAGSCPTQFANIRVCF